MQFWPLLIVIPTLLVSTGCNKTKAPEAGEPAREAAKPNAPPTRAAPGSSPPATTVAPAAEAAPDNATETLCVAAYDNLIAVSKKAGLSIPSIRKMEQDRAGFLARCATAEPGVTRCLAEAPDRKTAMVCSNAPLDESTEAEMTALCEKAYDHAVATVAKSGAPETTVQQMKDRRTDGIADCLREDPERIRCLLEADSVAGFESCRRTGKPTPEPIDPAHAAACKAAWDNMLKVVQPGRDMPPQAVEAMKKKPEAFAARCAASPRAIADCVAAAPDFATLRACHESTD